jgi:hypothetical protein
MMLASCDGQTPTGVQPCAQEVALTVGRGLTPNLSWTPACRLYGLEVTGAVAGSDSYVDLIWSIRGADENSVILPGLTYGVAPPGATVYVRAIRLEPGRQYFVRAVGFRGAEYTAAQVTFIP